jgi:hypothetical protein
LLDLTDDDELAASDMSNEATDPDCGVWLEVRNGGT